MAPTQNRAYETRPQDVSVTRPAVVLPPHLVRQEEVVAALREHFAGVPHLDRGLELMRNTTVDTRRLLVPLDEMLRSRPFGERNQRYSKEVVRLGAEAATQALELAGTTAQEIDYLVFVSCTGYMLPGPDAYIAQEIGCRPTTRRTPIQQLGCAAGVTALAEGYHFLRAYPRAQVLVVAVEISSLSFQPDRSSLSDFISAAIFSDGAAAAVMRRGRGDAGFHIRDSVQHLLPNSADVIYGETSEVGFHFLTNPKVRHTVPLVVPALTDLVGRQGWQLSDLGFCVSHTGGPLVMTGVAEGLGLPESAIEPSRRSLAEIGNPSSVSVFDVLRRHHEAPPPEGSPGLMVAFGPGFTTEALAGVWHRGEMGPLADRARAWSATGATGGPYPSPPDVFDLDLLRSGLVGRNREVAELRERLREPSHRLVTVTGPGGVGKSALVARLRADLIGDGAASCVLLDLAELDPDTDPRDLLPPPSGPAVLVLDHAEGRAGLVAELLATDLGHRLVCVSRSPLNLPGEFLFRLSPLAVPEDGLAASELAAVPSVELFLRRAREVDQSFRLTVANHRAVAGLCRKLEGLPLALELAAERLRLFPPAALLDRLVQHVDILQRAPGGTPARHDSMRACVAATYDQLSEEDRAILRRLAVFAGGFDDGAAEPVTQCAGATLYAALQSLVDVHLLTVEPAEARFAMPFAVRMFALDLLRASGELAEVRARHARYFADLVATVAPALIGSAQGRWLPRLAAERENLAAAYDVVREEDGRRAATFATELGPYWSATGQFRAGTERLRAALNAGQLGSDVVAPALAVAADLALDQGEYARATAQAEQALALFEEDRTGRAVCLRLLGRAAHGQGELVAAQRYLRRSLEDGAGPWHRAASQLALADLSLDADDRRLGETLAEAALQAYTAMDDRREAARARLVLAEVAILDGEPDRAELLCLDALRAYAALADATGAAQAYGILAAATTMDSDERRCQLRVAQLLGAAQGVRDRTGLVPLPRRVASLASVTVRARGILGATDFDREAGQAARGCWTQPLAKGPTLDPPPVRPAVTDLDTRLTRRERQVAELVALGLTNRQISSRLSIAEWTAVNHVRNVMRKLELTSRVQVARWFVLAKAG